MKIKDKVIFYVPTKRDKLKHANATRRREYRKFMRKMASDLSKRRGLARLREYPHIQRQKLLTCSHFKNTMRALRKASKHIFRSKWREHRRTFMGITQEDYIVKNRQHEKTRLGVIHNTGALRENANYPCLKISVPSLQT